MEFLKDLLGEDLYTQVVDKLGDKVELADLKTGNYISKEKLEETLRKLDTEWQEKFLNSAIRLNLKDKVHEKALPTAMGLFDKSKIELNEDGTIKLGFKEQLEAIQKDMAFLFVPEKQQEPPKVKGISPYESNADQKKNEPDTDPSIAVAKQAAQNATAKDAASANDYYFKKS